MEEVKIKKRKPKGRPGQVYDLSFQGMTPGQILAIVHGLLESRTPLALEVLDFLQRTLEQNVGLAPELDRIVGLIEKELQGIQETSESISTG